MGLEFSKETILLVPCLQNFFKKIRLLHQNCLLIIANISIIFSNPSCEVTRLIYDLQLTFSELKGIYDHGHSSNGQKCVKNSVENVVLLDKGSHLYTVHTVVKATSWQMPPLLWMEM